MKKLITLLLMFVSLISLSQCEIYSPTSFTPNNDGVNDYWQVVIPDTCCTEFVCQIFNHYGKVVWETTDPKDKWFGEASSLKYYCPNGVYKSLTVCVKQGDAQISYGSIFLIR